MIDNEFAYELPDPLVSAFDVPEMLDAYCWYKRSALPAYVRTEKDGLFADLRARFPFMLHAVAFLGYAPGAGTPVHIDYKRKAAINICVGGWQEASWGVTSFYESDASGTLDLTYNSINVPDSAARKVFEFRMTRPVLLNVARLHSIRMDPRAPGPRRLVSWGVDLPFEQARKALLAYT